MVIGMPDIQAIDFGDPDVMRPLIVQDPLPEVLPGLLWITVVAAAIAAGLSVFQGKLHGRIEAVRFEIFAQDKSAAVLKQHQSPDNIRLIRFCIGLLQKQKNHRSLMVVKLRWADNW